MADPSSDVVVKFPAVHKVGSEYIPQIAGTFAKSNTHVAATSGKEAGLLHPLMSGSWSHLRDTLQQGMGQHVQNLMKVSATVIHTAYEMKGTDEDAADEIAKIEKQYGTDPSLPAKKPEPWYQY